MRSSPHRPAASPAAAGGDEPVSVALERLGSWLRRAAPAIEWNAVALSTLAELGRRGQLRITDLVAAERISQPGMTGLIGRMAAAGLVCREHDPADGRATLVSLTAPGVSYLEHIHQVRARIIAEQLRSLSPAHRQALASACEAMDALAALPLTRGAQHP
ncbi:MAG: MarR family winged helix-turn-helix transcriptional regulator [Streptosporangiaceae bacterium]